jgi:hypothetical protein
MSEAEQPTAGQKADQLIATEVAIQERMWRGADEDNTDDQLLRAGVAQLVLLDAKLCGATVDKALKEANLIYPKKNWGDLRDYGSNIANLVVAAAFIRSEIKRRLLLGEDTTRAKRTTTYKGIGPHVSSDVAAALVSDSPPVK